MSPLQIITLTLALVAYGSFIWSVKGFFGVPKGGMPPLMKALSVLGLVNMIASVFFMVNHFATLPIFIGAAIGFYAASTALFWWAIRTHRKKPLAIAFTEHVPEHVVSEGPHRFVRHPFYTSYLLAWMGAAAATQHLAFAISLFILLGFYVRAARLEEAQFATSAIDSKYLEYKEKTGMFFPKTG